MVCDWAPSFFTIHWTSHISYLTSTFAPTMSRSIVSLASYHGTIRSDHSEFPTHHPMHMHWHSYFFLTQPYLPSATRRDQIILTLRRALNPQTCFNTFNKDRRYFFMKETISLLDIALLYIAATPNRHQYQGLYSQAREVMSSRPAETRKLPHLKYQTFRAIAESLIKAF